MNLKDLDCFKEVRSINLIEFNTRIEDSWLYVQEIQFRKENIETIKLNLKEEKLVYHKIKEYLHELSEKVDKNKYSSYKVTMAISSIRHELIGVKHFLKNKELSSANYYLTFVLSLIKSLEERL